MVSGVGAASSGTGSRRLRREERRRQLLEVALRIVGEEGADRLTLGHLAKRAGVSKPVAYDHFVTRSGLLIELYRWIDTEKVEAFRRTMAEGERPVAETAAVLAQTYVACAADTTGEFSAVGAALAGSEEKARVFQELLDNSVRMFVSVLQPHSELPLEELERRCVGLVAAGEALAAAMSRGRFSETEAVSALTALMRGSLNPV